MNDLKFKFAELYRTKKYLYLRFIRTKIYKREDAEDILQDVFTNIFESIQNDPKEITNPEGWVFRSIKNRLVDFYRKKKIYTYSKIDSLTDEDISETESIWNSNFNENPEKILINKELFSSIEQSMNVLTKRQKEAFVKNKFQGISFIDIAKDQGLTLNCVLSREWVARLKMRNVLQDIYKECVEK